MNFFILFAVVWGIFAILAKGYSYSYSQNEFKLIAEEVEAQDNAYSWALSIAGPVALLAFIVSAGGLPYPPRFRRYKYINGIRQV